MFRWRLVSSVSLAILLLLSLQWSGWAGAIVFSVLIGLFALVALDEYLALTRGFGYGGLPRLTRVFAVLIITAVGISPVFLGEAHGPLAQALEALVISVFMVFAFREVFRHADRRTALINFMVSLAGLIYICWTLSFIPKLFFLTGLGQQGRWLAFFLLAVTKSGDIGAYVVGSLTARRASGNHKVVPEISPKKSWEGLFGGIAASIGVACLLVSLSKGMYVLHGVPLLTYPLAIFWGFFCTILGFWGDLAESALKRAADVKNSGMIPGLGGALDVLDSLTLTAPFFYAYVQIAVALGR